MQFLPWRYIADWNCDACGLCCKAYSVVLNFQEWLRIVKSYGAEQTMPGLNKLFIKRRNDGSCNFLYNADGIHLCTLQPAKPEACKLWPFKILTRPQYGYANDAFYRYGESVFYVYADYNCTGLRIGDPTRDFANQTLKEFVELAIGIRRNQFKTTGNVSQYRGHNLRF